MPTLNIGLNPRDAIFGLSRLVGSSKNAQLAMLGVVGAATAIATALTLTSVSMARVAGDAEEIGSKFKAVFKGETERSAKSLRAFNAEAGRSAVGLKELAASTQDILVPMGLAREVSADLSLLMSELATDVASFQNKTDEGVSQAFQSGLVGNVRALQQLGITLSAVEVKEEAVRLGLADTTREVTNQDKALARASLIIERSSDAQGDAIRTAKSYQNTLKTLSGTYRDLQSAIGTTVTGAFKNAIQETIGLDVAAASLEVTLTGVADIAARAIGLGANVIKSFTEDNPRINKIALDNALQRSVDAGTISEEQARIIRRRAATKAANVPQLKRPATDIRTTGGSRFIDDERGQAREFKLGLVELFGIENETKIAKFTDELVRMGVALEDINAVGATTINELRDAFSEEFNAVVVNENLARRDAIIEKGKLLNRETAVPLTEADISRQFFEENRVGLTAASSAVDEFSTGLTDVSLGFATLEEAGRSAFDGIAAAILKASYELVAFGALKDLLRFGGADEGFLNNFFGQLGFEGSGLFTLGQGDPVVDGSFSSVSTRMRRR